jgi:hypothetical protein
MANILAIVSKAAFEQDADLGVGDVYTTSEYVSKNKALDRLADHGSLFLVTARPGDALWLVGILESPVFVGDRWTAQANAVKVVDITARMGELRFENGNGIQFAPGKLGMALQAPRRLTNHDVALLRGLAGSPTAAKTAASSVAKSVANLADKVVSSVKSIASPVGVAAAPIATKAAARSVASSVASLAGRVVASAKSVAKPAAKVAAKTAKEVALNTAKKVVAKAKQNRR